MKNGKLYQLDNIKSELPKQLDCLSKKIPGNIESLGSQNYYDLLNTVEKIKAIFNGFTYVDLSNHKKLEELKKNKTNNGFAQILDEEINKTEKNIESYNIERKYYNQILKFTESLETILQREKDKYWKLAKKKNEIINELEPEIQNRNNKLPKEIPINYVSEKNGKYYRAYILNQEDLEEGGKNYTIEIRDNKEIEDKHGNKKTKKIVTKFIKNFKDKEELKKHLKIGDFNYDYSEKNKEDVKKKFKFLTPEEVKKQIDITKKNILSTLEKTQQKGKEQEEKHNKKQKEKKEFPRLNKKVK